jgi:hypothetical protein
MLLRLSVVDAPRERSMESRKEKERERIRLCLLSWPHLSAMTRLILLHYQWYFFRHYFIIFLFFSFALCYMCLRRVAINAEFRLEILNCRCKLQLVKSLCPVRCTEIPVSCSSSEWIILCVYALGENTILLSVDAVGSKLLHFFSFLSSILQCWTVCWW